MKIKLTPAQRDFLVSISRAIYTNPFGRRRRLADSAVTGLSPDTDPTLLLDRVIILVADNIREFKTRQQATLSRFSGDEQRLVRNLFVFHVFHRYLEKFDHHILKQSNTASPLRLGFADDILGELEQFGFTGREADKYLALFFQMRRAFFFIKNSLIGTSASMEKLRSRLWNNIFTHDIEIYADLLWNRLEDFSTLLLGETGTGKGVVATAIGRSGFIPYDRKKACFSESFAGAFLSINLSQFPEQLIESELFGHARGAFTGAVQDHKGIFSRSSLHGAVFLDEIGEVSIPIQIKLLRILQERSFSPVGGSKQERFAGRVIGATNRDVCKLRREGKFRDDFYHRLSSDSITIPPLRDRLQEDPGELALLTDFLLTRIMGKNSGKLLTKIVAAIRKNPGPAYHWPGNVRELEQCIRQILLHGKFQAGMQSEIASESTRLAEQFNRGELSVTELTSRYCNVLFRQYGTYQEVARRTGLDRRTVKKYLNS